MKPDARTPRSDREQARCKRTESRYEGQNRFGSFIQDLHGTGSNNLNGFHTIDVGAINLCECRASHGKRYRDAPQSRGYPHDRTRRFQEYGTNGRIRDLTATRQKQIGQSTFHLPEPAYAAQTICCPANTLNTLLNLRADKGSLAS